VRLYLSSWRIGRHPEIITGCLSKGSRIGYISNAIDDAPEFSEVKEAVNQRNHAELRELGLVPTVLNLKDYFENPSKLEVKVRDLAALWVSGGNVFVLRQAMKLSGLDRILAELASDREFFYGGYSAGACVCSPNLSAFQIVDNPTVLPYPLQRETIYEGLGLIEFAFLPHFKSNHSDSAAIDLEVDYCQKSKISYRAFQDGEVFVAGI
jgi:dipeptidase E